MKKTKISTIILLVSALTILLTSSCKKEEVSPVNLAPYNVILYLPINAASEITLNDSISWHKVTDPEGDVVSYDVYFGTDAEPELVSSNQTSTTFKPTLTSETTYYWKVAAKDSKGGISESGIWSFTTYNVPPSEFNLLSPGNEEYSVSVGFLTFTWQESVDLEGGLITYDVYLGTQPAPTTVISTNQDSTSLFLNSALQGLTYYYWKVTAKDPAGNITQSETWRFRTALY